MINEDNIYQAPASQSELKPDQKVAWSGKKLLLITVFPSLALAACYLSLLLELPFIVESTGSSLFYIPILAAISCSIWTGYHLVSVRGGNWLDCVGYSLMWAVIHSITIVVSFFIGITLLGVLFGGLASFSAH